MSYIPNPLLIFQSLSQSFPGRPLSFSSTSTSLGAVRSRPIPPGPAPSAFECSGVLGPSRVRAPQTVKSFNHTDHHVLPSPQPFPLPGMFLQHTVTHFNTLNIEYLLCARHSFVYAVLQCLASMLNRSLGTSVSIAMALVLGHGLMQVRCINALMSLAGAQCVVLSWEDCFSIRYLGTATDSPAQPRGLH